MEHYFPGPSHDVLVSLPLTIGFAFLTVQLTDKKEVRSEHCNLRTSLVSSWKRTNSLLLKRAQGFSRSQHEQLGFRNQGRSEWQWDFRGGGRWGEKWLGLSASLLYGASDRWQCLLENKTHFVSPSLDKAQITASPQHTHPPLQLFCSSNTLSLFKLMVKERIHSFFCPTRLQEKGGSAAEKQHGIMLFFKTPPALPSSF